VKKALFPVGQGTCISNRVSSIFDVNGYFKLSEIARSPSRMKNYGGRKMGKEEGEVKDLVEKMFNPKTSYGLAILSGILLLLSFPPFKFGGFLAWFAFVPLLIALFYETKVKRMERLSKIAGLGCILIFLWLAWFLREILSVMLHLENLSWLWFIIGLLLAVSMAREFHTMNIMDYWKTKELSSKNLPYLPSALGILIIPLVVTCFEFLLMNVPGLMRIGGIWGSWSIAKTQWFNPAILHLASFTGMYGVTFLVLLVNCAIVYGIIHYKEDKKISKPTIIVLCLFVIIFSYGLISVPGEVKGDVTVAVIQSPSVDGEDINDLYLRLSNESLKYNPQIIVWPFLMAEGFSFDSSTNTNFTQDHNLYLVSAGVISPDGSTESDNLGYHMVTLPKNIKDKDMKAIFFPEVHSLNTDLGNLGIVVCIESSSTLPARDRVKDGAQVLIVPTASPNTYVFSWALGTNAIYRAAEHKVFAVEVIGDHDSSMIIDPYGRIVDDTAPEPEIVTGEISFTNERTFYTKYGDIFGWTIVGLAIILVIYNSYLKRKSPFRYCLICRNKMKKEAKICPKCGSS
jgi:apolipoprotein N-acyltransferase